MAKLKPANARAKTSSKKSSGNWKRKLGRLFLFLFVSHLLYVVALKWINPPITARQMSSIWHCAQSDATFKRDYISFAAMSKPAKLAVIAAEDQLFPTHRGFDLDAIQKAIEYNSANEGKKMRGASTISQQVAKNVFLWNGRDWIRKGLEVYFTALIELVWGKKRILETYLNVAEMGEGVFGVEAAAQHYFKKNAKNLSTSEAAWIATVLPNPIVYKIKNPTERIRRKHQKIMQFMRNLNTDKEVQEIVED